MLGPSISHPVNKIHFTESPIYDIFLYQKSKREVYFLRSKCSNSSAGKELMSWQT